MDKTKHRELLDFAAKNMREIRKFVAPLKINPEFNPQIDIIGQFDLILNSLGSDSFDSNMVYNAGDAMTVLVSYCFQVLPKARLNKTYEKRKQAFSIACKAAWARNSFLGMDGCIKYTAEIAFNRAMFDGKTRQQAQLEEDKMLTIFKRNEGI